MAGERAGAKAAKEGKAARAGRVGAKAAERVGARKAAATVLAEVEMVWAAGATELVAVATASVAGATG